MSKLKHYNQFQNLAQYRTLVTDTDEFSRFFRLTQLPDTLVGGKNAFLINGSAELEPTTEVLVEIIAADGSVIFHQPIKNYQEGLARVVSIEIYQDTPPGPAVMTILGELQVDENGNAIPAEWQNKYNVKYTHTFTVNPFQTNDETIRFYQTPNITVTEQLSQYRDTIVGGAVILNTGTVIGSTFTNIFNTGDTATIPAYAIKTSQPLLSASLVGAPFTASVSTGLFTASIVEVLNNTTAFVSGGYISGNVYAPFSASVWNITTTGSSQFIPTSFTRSFANITINNLTTFSGQVQRAKIWVRSVDSHGDYEAVSDVILQPTHLMQTQSLADLSFISIGNITTQSIINSYWTEGSLTGSLGFPLYVPSNAVTVGYDAATLMNSMHITSDGTLGATGSLAPKYFIGTNANLGFLAGLEYVLHNDIVCISSGNFDARLEVYLSGSAFPTTNTLGQLITSYDCNSTQFTVIADETNFIANASGSATLNYVIYGGDWHISNVDVFSAYESGFNPDQATALTIVSNKRLENLQFKVQLFDANNNAVPLDLVSPVAFFNGGNFFTKGTDNRLQGILTVAPSGSGPTLGVDASGSFIGIGQPGVLAKPLDISLLSAYTGSPIVTMYSGSLPFQNSPSASAIGLQLVAGQSVSSSYLDFNTLTGRLTIRGDITLLPGTALSASVASAQSGSSGSGATALAQIQSLVNGILTIGGTYLDGTTIVAPTIGGNTGYFASTFGVGNIGARQGIILTALGYTASNGTPQSGSPSIYIGQGTFGNANTPFLVASSSAGGILSLGNQLIATSSAGQFALIVSGTLAVLSGSTFFDVRTVINNTSASVSQSQTAYTTLVSASLISVSASFQQISASVINIATSSIPNLSSSQAAYTTTVSASLYAVSSSLAQTTASFASYSASAAQSQVTLSSSIAIQAAANSASLTSQAIYFSQSQDVLNVVDFSNKIKLPPMPTNLISNGDFEISTQGWSAPHISMSVSSFDSYFGKQSLKITDGGPVAPPLNFTDIGFNYFVDIGSSGKNSLVTQSFTWGFWAKTDSPSGTSSFSGSTFNGFLGITSLCLLSASGSTQFIAAISPVPKLTNSWQLYTGSGTFPNNVTGSTIQVQLQGLSGSSLPGFPTGTISAYIDGVFLVSGSGLEIPKFIPGLYLESSSMGFWQPHASGSGSNPANFPVVINSQGQFLFADSGSWSGTSASGYFKNYVGFDGNTFIINTPNVVITGSGLYMAGLSGVASTSNFIKVGTAGAGMSLTNNAGFYVDGAGNFRVGTDTTGSDYVQLTPGNALIVSSSNFILQSTNAGNTLHIDPLQIELGNPVPTSFTGSANPGAAGFYVNRNGQLFIGSGNVGSIAGTGTGSWISFDGTDLNIKSQKIFLNSPGFQLQGVDASQPANANVFKLGANASTITLTKNQGIYMDGSGSVRFGTDTSASLSSSYIEFIPGNPSSLVISSSLFFLNGKDLSNNTVKINNFVMELGNPVPITHTPTGVGSIGMYADNQGHFFIGSGAVGSIAGQGTGSWISFDASTLNIRASRLFLNSNGLVLQGADSLSGTSNVIKVGAAGSGITLSNNAGFYVDGGGNFRVGTDTSGSDFLQLTPGNALIISSSNILLSTPTITIDSKAGGSNPVIYVSSSIGPAINISADGGTASFAGTVFAGGLVVNGTAFFTGSSLLNAPLQVAIIKTVQTNKITNTILVSQSNASVVNNITMVNGTETLFGWSSDILNVTSSTLAGSSSVILGDYQVTSGSLSNAQSANWGNTGVAVDLSGRSTWISSSTTPTLTISPSNGQQSTNNVYMINGGIDLVSTLGTTSTGFTSADGRVDLHVSYDNGTTWTVVDTVVQDSIGALGNQSIHDNFSYPFSPTGSLNNGDSFKLRLLYWAQLNITKVLGGGFFEVNDSGGSDEMKATWQFSAANHFHRRGLQILAQTSGSTLTTGSMVSFNLQPMTTAPNTTTMTAGDFWSEQTSSIAAATLYWFNGVNKIKLG